MGHFPRPFIPTGTMPLPTSPANSNSIWQQQQQPHPASTSRIRQLTIFFPLSPYQRLTTSLHAKGVGTRSQWRKFDSSTRSWNSALLDPIKQGEPENPKDKPDTRKPITFKMHKFHSQTPLPHLEVPGSGSVAFVSQAAKHLVRKQPSAGFFAKGHTYQKRNGATECTCQVGVWKSPCFVSPFFTPDNFYTGQLLYQAHLHHTTFYTRHLLHQTPFTPDTLVHQKPFTPDTFYTRHLLHHTPFTPNTFYTNHLLHQTNFTLNTVYTRHPLHQTTFTPDTFYTGHLLYQAHLHQTPFTPHTFYNRLLYTRQLFH